MDFLQFTIAVAVHLSGVFGINAVSNSISKSTGLAVNPAKITSSGTVCVHKRLGVVSYEVSKFIRGRSRVPLRGSVGGQAVGTIFFYSSQDTIPLQSPHSPVFANPAVPEQFVLIRGCIP